MSDGPVLGIDLGTTNSVVAVADGGQARVLADAEGRRIVPSVVSFLPDGPTLVGYEARERRLLDAANTVYAVKRLIGRPFASPEVTRARERFAFEIVPNKHGGSVVKVARGTYALAEISAMVLRELRRTAELNLGMNAERAVITVPANFNELQRSATKAAGKVAGLEVLRILNEPTAAALAYGYGSGGNNERIAVYDLGGGTFDITILELEDDVFEVLSTAGDTFLGGEDIDRAVAEVMSDRFREEHGIDPRRDPQAYERLKAAAEWAKCQLSSEPVVELTIEELVIDGGGRNLDLYFAMTRRELEDLVRPWIERSLTVVDGALSEAGVTVFDLDSVLLVGGSTRMPLCRNMVTEHFRREPRIDIDPDMVVAQGAAIHAYALGGSTARVELPREVPRPPSPRKTDAGVPRQPAFAPDEVSAAPPPPRRPARKTTPPPAVPDLPPPVLSASVLISPAVEVRPRKTSIELELDDLAPPPMGSDPFAQIEADDPFAAPRKGGMARLPMPAIETALDTPFEIEAHSPEQRSVAKTTGGPWTPPEMIVSREPTQPFATERQNNDHARTLVVGDVPEPPPPPKPPPPPPAARRPTDPALARTAMWAQPPLPAPDITNAARPVRDPAIAFDVARPPPQPVVAMPERAPPLLMDVTPHSLGIETAGGFVKKLIIKNAPVPTEQSRTFTTARDDQREVVVRVCQGENDRFSDNQELGEVILDHLPPHPRGALSIDVAFILDADGTLAVEARDAQSGRVQRTRIQLRGGLSADEIEAMRARHRTERFR